MAPPALMPAWGPHQRPVLNRNTSEDVLFICFKVSSCLFCLFVLT